MKPVPQTPPSPRCLIRSLILSISPPSRKIPLHPTHFSTSIPSISVMIMMSAHFGHFMSASFGSVIATSLGQLIAAPVVKLKGYWMTEHIVRWRVKVNRQKSEMPINDRSRKQSDSRNMLPRQFRQYKPRSLRTEITKSRAVSLIQSSIAPISASGSILRAPNGNPTIRAIAMPSFHFIGRIPQRQISSHFHVTTT